MSRGAIDAAEHAAHMRREFDDVFALPRRVPDETLVSLLVVRVEGDRYAVRLADIASVVVDRTIVPLPGSGPDLAGVAGVRGTIVPVYALANLIGYPASKRRVRVLVVTGERDAIALAAEGMDGLVRVRPSDIASIGDDRSGRGCVRNIAQISPDEAVPVVDVASVLDAVRTRVAARSPREDHET